MKRKETMFVRKAVVLDAELIVDVVKRSVLENCLEDHGGNQDILDLWLKNKTPENMRRCIEWPGNVALVSIHNGRLCGFALLCEDGELAMCYILPDVRFKGVGKALLSCIEEAAKNKKLREITLNSSKTGHAFYLRNGYRNTGEIDEIFGMKSFAMKKSLT